jgi:hypothetical protein
VLRRIFGSMRDEMAGSWRKLCVKKLHNLYSSPNIVRIIKSSEVGMCGACNTHGGNEKCLHGWNI